MWKRTNWVKETVKMKRKYESMEMKNQVNEIFQLNEDVN